MMVVDKKGLDLISWSVVSEKLFFIIKLLFKFFIVIGGSIPYVFQYIEIQQRRNAQGFSLFVCLALCVANILRILFWFGKRFDTALLLQSIVMLATMVAMLELAVRTNRKHVVKAHRRSVLAGHVGLRDFWAWHDLSSFVILLLAFTATWSILTAIFITQPIYVEFLGLLALCTEATLAWPQLWRNFKRGSTCGMSVPMVLAWLIGDLAKTGYFIAEAQPTQFFICAGIQITVDVLILLQVVVYGRRTSAADAADAAAVDESPLPYTASSPAHSTVE